MLDTADSGMAKDCIDAKRSSPHPLFDADWYRRSHPDIPSHLATFGHYLSEGWRKLKSPHPLFSVEYYFRQRPDVRNAGVEPLGHFVTQGWKEGSNPHPLFDVEFYLSQGPDLGGADPLTHYLSKGWALGLQPNGMFDVAWYLNSNSDVEASGVEPLRHYLEYGWREGRVPHPQFDGEKYLQKYPDVRGVNPLAHYLSYGKREGRFAFGTAEIAFLDSKLKEFEAEFRDANYQEWIRRDEILRIDRERMLIDIEAFSKLPFISVIMPTYNSNITFLEKAIDSVVNQIYPYWELCIADDASPNHDIVDYLKRRAAVDPRIKLVLRAENGHISRASNSAIEVADGEYISFIDHDDEISPDALYWVAREINNCLGANFIYTDQDKIDTSGARFDPYFKPEFSLDLLRSQNFVDHLATFRASLVREVGCLRPGYEGSQDYDLVLRVVDCSTPEQIRHIPHVLYHWRSVPGSIAHDPNDKSYAPERSGMALRDHLERNHIRAEVLAPFPQISIHRVKYALPNSNPLVSIIIPTKDRPDLLRSCTDSIFLGTDYEPYEVIIINNQSEEPETFDLFRTLELRANVKVIDYDKKFNYAEMNNNAASYAAGSILCFLNNDVRALNADWLEEMVRHACRPEIGAVGARLLYPNGLVQHSGIFIGYRGVAGHAFRYMPQHHLGTWARGMLIQNFSAVTAACLAVRSSVFHEVGGFNADDLPITFNDVDLCLRIVDHGYRNLFTPFAELVHEESVTRGLLAYESEEEFFKLRWKKYIERDPFYNPNLSLKTESFVLP